jgi:DNA (cytosine-5)-methyltransferase 1
MSRPLACPSRTLDTASGSWTIESLTPPTGLDPRQGSALVRPVEVPAFTLVSSGLAHGLPRWVHERPATTILGDRRVQPPGHKRNATDPPGRYQGRDGTNAARVTVEQATILHGFRPDYPWQGPRYQQFRQIGNAVCPPIARLVLDAAMRCSR